MASADPSRRALDGPNAAPTAIVVPTAATRTKGPCGLIADGAT